MACWVTAADGLHHVHVLIWNLPENFLPDAFLNLCFCNQGSLLMPIQDHLDPLGRDVFPRKIVGLSHYIAQSRNFCNCDHIDLIAVTEQIQIFIV